MTDLDPAATDEATSLLVLAEKLHQEHVTAGEEEAARLVEEARTSSAELLANAEQEARALVGDAREQASELEERIAKLQEFEAAYRGALKEVISKASLLLGPADEPLEEPVVVPALAEQDYPEEQALADLEGEGGATAREEEYIAASDEAADEAAEADLKQNIQDTVRSNPEEILVGEVRDVDAETDAATKKSDKD